jgi:hypothetical protein
MSAISLGDVSMLCHGEILGIKFHCHALIYVAFHPSNHKKEKRNGGKEKVGKMLWQFLSNFRYHC